MKHIAIIGAGAISDSHIEGCLAYPQRCRVVAIVDRDIDKAKAKIAKHGLCATALTDTASLLSLPGGVHIACICLPPALHRDVAVQLLQNGIHVLCEKPLAPSLDACDDMISAAKAGGAVLSTVAQNRFKPDVYKIKKLLESGMLGRLTMATVLSLWWRGENYYNLDWRGRWETEGGGCTLAHAIHHIDLMLWYMGNASQVTAIVDNLAHTNSEVEDMSMAMVRFASGAAGAVVSSLLHHGEQQRLTIDSMGGSVGLPLSISASEQMENGFPNTNERMVSQMRQFLDSVTLRPDGHTGQIDDLLTALETGQPPMVTGEDGRRVIEFISAMYQSAFLKKPVSLPMTPADPFYTQQGKCDGAHKFYEKTVSVFGFSDDTIQVGGTL